MIIEPRVRGFICTTAHPAGCREHVKQLIQEIQHQPPINHGPSNVLIIGASTGYGLASWITALFGARAKAVGVFFERSASGNRTATAGWYNAAAVEEFARQENLFAASVNGDAFSQAIKLQTCDLLKRTLGKIDLVIYSLASPRRVLPASGETVSSVLKTVDKPFHSKTVDPLTGKMSTVEMMPASPEEIQATVQVMGGEDWYLWLETLQQQQLLAEGALTVAYSYVGPEMTYPIYRQGTIGKAKEHLEQTVGRLNELLESIQGQAYVSVNKAVVTQASSAIPVVPLYISLLFKIMKEKKLHEGCIEQIYRLFRDKLDKTQLIATDQEGRIRIDDLEMSVEVQDAIHQVWEKVNQENILQLADITGYQQDFYRLFGFGFTTIDYTAPVNINVQIPSLVVT